MSRKIIIRLCCIPAFVLLFAGSHAAELTKAPVDPGEVKDANPTRYYAELAAIHQRYKVYDKAEECLKKAIETEQNTAAAADYAYQLGRLYIEWGKGKEAEMMFEFCLEQTPNTGSALITRSRELAQVYESSGQFDKAEAIYKMALEKSSPQVAQAVERDYYQLAKKTGKLDAIIAEKEKKLEADPKDVRLLSALATLYRIKGDRPKEIGVYKNIVQQNPKDLQTLSQLAVAYRDEGDTEKAVQTYQSLTEINPMARPYYVSEIVKLYAKAGKQEEVDTWMGKLADEKELATAAGRARLARLYQDVGALDKAIEQFKSAVALAAEPMQREQYQLQLARACFAAKQFDESEKLCRMLEKEGKSASVQQEARAVLGRIQAGKQQNGEPPPAPEPKQP